MYSGIRSKLVYAYKLVDAGFTISGIGVRARFILFKDKPILWCKFIVLGLFNVLITPVDSVNEFILLREMYIRLTDVICEPGGIKSNTMRNFSQILTMSMKIFLPPKLKS